MIINKFGPLTMKQLPTPLLGWVAIRSMVLLVAFFLGWAVSLHLEQCPQFQQFILEILYFHCLPFASLRVESDSSCR